MLVLLPLECAQIQSLSTGLAAQRLLGALFSRFTTANASNHLGLGRQAGARQRGAYPDDKPIARSAAATFSDQNSALASFGHDLDRANGRTAPVRREGLALRQTAACSVLDADLQWTGHLGSPGHLPSCAACLLPWGPLTRPGGWP